MWTTFSCAVSSLFVSSKSNATSLSLVIGQHQQQTLNSVLNVLVSFLTPVQLGQLALVSREWRRVCTSKNSWHNASSLLYKLYFPTVPVPRLPLNSRLTGHDLYRQTYKLILPRSGVHVWVDVEDGHLFTPNVSFELNFASEQQERVEWMKRIMKGHLFCIHKQVLPVPFTSVDSLIPAFQRDSTLTMHKLLQMEGKHLHASGNCTCPSSKACLKVIVSFDADKKHQTFQICTDHRVNQDIKCSLPTYTQLITLDYRFAKGHSGFMQLSIPSAPCEPLHLIPRLLLKLCIWGFLDKLYTSL